MSASKLLETLSRGVKTRCSISGLYFYQDEMVRDPQGQWTNPKFVRFDKGRSAYKSGPGWERWDLG